jgi:capsular exopolysaccharide synthesis family protein
MEKLDFSQFENEEKELEIKYVILKYIKYWPYYILFIANFLFATYVFHRYTVDEYSVAGTMVIKANTTPEARILDRSSIFSGQSTLENDILMLTSKQLAREALKKIHFDVEYWAKTNIKPIELYDRSPVRIEVDWDHMQLPDVPMQLNILSEKTFRLGPEEPGFFDFSPVMAQGDESLYGQVFTFGEPIVTTKSKFTVHLVNPGRIGEVLIFRLRHPSVLEEGLARSVSVSMVNASASVLEIRTTTRVVEKGRDYINALMESYLEYELKEKNRNSENTLRFIEEQLGYLEDSLRKKERELQNFKIENRMINVASEFTGLLGKMDRLEEQYQELEFQQAYYRSIMQYMNQRSMDFTQVIAPSVVGIPDPLLNGLIQTLVTLSQDRRKLLASVNENHPEIAKIDVQMTKVQEALFENVNNLVANTETKKSALRKDMDGYETEFLKMPEAESRFSSINREYILRENLYTYLLEKRAEIGIAKASNVSDNSILDYAKKGVMVFPKKERNYLLAIAFGFLIPFGFFWLKDFFDDRINDQRDLKKHFVIPQLGVIGHSKKETNMVVLEHPKSAVAESFRSLRSAINYLSAGKASKKILVTSSVSGEGKTFTSLNLASVMALGGKRTIVVGADLRRPKLASYFNHSEKIGLSQFLIGKVTEADIILPTQHANLYFVPSGPIPPNPAELLQTDKLKNFLDYLEANFDIVVFDTPPLGLVSETVDLMQLFDINLYVVRQNYTLKDHLVMINDLFNNKQVKNVYGVFNGIVDSGYYYEGYNYGYGNTYLYSQKNQYINNYYGDEESKKKRLKRSRNFVEKVWKRIVKKNNG